MSTVAEYLASLAQQAGFDDESKTALQKVLANQKFTEELDKGVKRQSEFSRAMDEAKRIRDEAEAKITQWKSWYDEAVVRDAEREAEFQRVKGSNGNAGAGNGSGNGSGNGTGTNPDVLTRKQIEEREGRMISIVKQGMRLASRHAAKFGEELDVDALEKLAVEKGLTLDRAYEEMVAPRVQAAKDKEFADKIAAARAEGVQEGLSKRDVPGEGSKAFHPIFGHRDEKAGDGKLTDGQRRSNFEQAFNEAAVAKK